MSENQPSIDPAAAGTAQFVGYAPMAAICGIKQGTLYAMVARKKIPHYRIGKRHVLFSVPEVLDWIKSQRRAV